jgi:hypothetical protein
VEEKLSDEQQQRLISIMVTEHFALAGGRGNTISEANGRASVFLSTVSSSLIALTFVGQISELGTAFYVFALVLLPTLFFLGLVTFERTLQSSIEDMFMSRGINRIRHLYVELAPQSERYFIYPTSDDPAAWMRDMGVTRAWWQLFLTTAGMVSIINGVIAGVFAGLLIHQFVTGSLLVGFGSGIAVVVLCVVALTRYQITNRQRASSRLPVLFPAAEQR